MQNACMHSQSNLMFPASAASPIICMTEATEIIIWQSDTHCTRAQHRDLHVAICRLHTGLAHHVVQFAVATGEKVQSLVRLFMARSTSGHCCAVAVVHRVFTRCKCSVVYRFGINT